MKNKQIETEFETETETEIDSPLENVIFGDGDDSNEDREKARQQALKSIEFLSLPRAKSRDLLGVEFDILDAVKTEISETKDGVRVTKKVISFIITTDDNIKSVVTKAINTYTEAYLKYFESFDKDEKIEPMRGYTFVEVDGGQAGNKPITFRKV